MGQWETELCDMAGVEIHSSFKIEIQILAGIYLDYLMWDDHQITWELAAHPWLTRFESALSRDLRWELFLFDRMNSESLDTFRQSWQISPIQLLLLEWQILLSIGRWLLKVLNKIIINQVQSGHGITIRKNPNFTVIYNIDLDQARRTRT